MHNFKISYLWVLLIFFLSGKTHSVIGPIAFNALHKEQQKEVKEKINNSADTSAEKYTIPRKRKTRGIAGAVPQISDITFIGSFTYRTFKPYYTENTYASFRYCVSLKRGPPLG